MTKFIVFLLASLGFVSAMYFVIVFSSAYAASFHLRAASLDFVYTNESHHLQFRPRSAWSSAFFGHVRKVACLHCPRFKVPSHAIVCARDDWPLTAIGERKRLTSTLNDQ